jgi:hypothetical protein
MIKEIVYTKTKREMPCQFNKLTINTTWSICFKNHRQDGDFIGNYRMRRFPTAGIRRYPTVGKRRKSKDIAGFRLSASCRIRLSENVGFSWDPIGSCGVASTWVLLNDLPFLSLFKFMMEMNHKTI